MREKAFDHVGFLQSVLAPEYDGPPLRMPYLTPYTAAAVSERYAALKGLPWEQQRGLFGPEATFYTADYHSAKFPRWRTVDGQAQYRCHPSGEAALLPLERSDVWIAHPFPETLCQHCGGLTFSSPAAWQTHVESWRHFENVMYPGETEEVLELIVDPRMIDGDAAFNALPKYEAFARMKRYTRFYEGQLERLRIESNWSTEDRANLESHAQFANERSALRRPGEYNDTDSGEDEITFTANDIACIVVGNALDGFQDGGPHSEIPGVPYSTPADLVFGGLAVLDPCGGSSSASTFMETLFQG